MAMTTDTADRAALEREVEAYMGRPYVMQVVWDEDYWAATFPELPGLVAAADTFGELEQKIHDAKWSYFEAALEAGLPIAEPGGGEPASGRVLLRLPKSLHRQVARAAARDGVSVNTFLVSAIAKDLGRRESHNESRATRTRGHAHDVEAWETTYTQISSPIPTGAPTPTTPADAPNPTGGQPSISARTRGARTIRGQIQNVSGEVRRRGFATPTEGNAWRERVEASEEREQDP